MQLSYVIGLIFVLAVAYAVFKPRSGIRGTEARDLVQAGARLIDVRTAAEFASGHIAGAINIPVQDLERRMSELDNKERPIVVYCRSGGRSGNAAGMLKNAGYVQVHDLGAMTRW